MTRSTTGLSEVAAAIAGLSFSGITNLGTSAIPESATMSGRVFYPRPMPAFITDFRVEYDSFGSNVTSEKTAYYTLNYMYLHAPIAATLGGIFDSYDGLVTNIDVILGTLATSEISVDNLRSFRLPQLINVGAVTDPAGNQYHGAEIAINVEIFV